MFTILHALGMLVADLFKSRTRLEAENLFLRHQLNIALRRAPPRLRLRGSDRALLILMTMLWPRLLGAAQLVQPETILRWHRTGFKAFWRWKSRKRAGRPKIDRGLRDLIQRMSKENPQWGASRIHGELLMLGFAVAQSTVSKYMVRPSKPPSQSWKTFLRNHAQAIAAIDLCVVPTLTFDRLFAFLVLGHDRRQLLWAALSSLRAATAIRSSSPRTIPPSFIPSAQASWRVSVPPRFAPGMALILPRSRILSPCAAIPPTSCRAHRGWAQPVLQRCCRRTQLCRSRA